MQAFSTDHLRPRDRFEFWRDAFARPPLGLDAEIASERRLDFSGDATISAVGPACMIAVESSACSMRPMRTMIDQQASERGLYIWHLVSGGGTMVLGDSVERAASGSLVMGCGHVLDMYRPDADASPPGERGGQLVLMIPRSVLSGIPLAPDRFLPRRQGDSHGLDVLLRSYLATFIEQAPRLAGVNAEHAVRALAHVALGARNAIDIREDAAAAAIREALLVRARRLIERDLSRPDLSPALVAGRLGISVRKLHLVFEPGGVSFSRYVLARRLARADRLIREMPQMSVTQAAFAVGFESLSTFFRSYRAAYGVSPGERRSP